MKKISTLFLAALMAFTITSCSSSDDNTATPSNNSNSIDVAARTTILTGTKWKVTAATVDGQSVIGTLLEACDIDNSFEFNANGEYIVNEGLTKCDPANPQVNTKSTWKFVENGAKLESDGDVYTIKEFSATKIVMEGTIGTAKSSLTYEPYTAPSKTEFLTSRKWEITNYIVNNVDEYPSFDACEQDDNYEFKKDGNYIEDEGATKCDPMDPQSETYNWKFIDNETKVEIDGDIIELKELTFTKLVLIEDEGNGQTATVTYSNE